MMSYHQKRYREYIDKHPGCCIADVVRACMINPRAGHRWVYDGVHRLIKRGIVKAERKRGRVYLY